MTSGLNPILPDGEYGDPDVPFYFSDGLRIREIAGRSGADTVSGADTGQRTWRVTGTFDPQRAKRAIIDSPDLLINEYDDMRIESLSYDQGPSFDSWDFTGSYNATVPSAPTATNPGYTVSIDTTGGTILQTSSYAQTRFPATGKTLPDYLRSIDVQDGTPQGVERIIPVTKINVRAKIATHWISSPARYTRLITELTGTTNNADIFSDSEGTIYKRGELLFAGASGEVVAEEPQLTFSFLASKNLTNGTIGDITGINKRGHDYLWFLFDFEKDAATGLLISKPRGCYVDQIYGEADHTLLKIGAPAPPPQE